MEEGFLRAVYDELHGGGGQHQAHKARGDVHGYGVDLGRLFYGDAENKVTGEPHQQEQQEL